MLIAKEQGGCLISGSEYREALSRNEAGQRLVCPGCGEAVIFKNGREKIPHFAHQINQECRSLSEGETAEHLAGKELLLRLLPAEACLEAYLPELAQRPDLLWRRLAVEFQCSGITARRFQERTHNYLVQGYDPWWILGRRFLPGRGLRWSQLTKAVVRASPQGLELWGLDTKQERLLYYHDLDWHYREGALFAVTECFVGASLFAGLFHPGSRCHKPVPKPRWEIAEYRLQLQRSLASRTKGMIRLQGACYQLGGNLLALPDWCYLPGRQQFLLEQQLVGLRFLFSRNPQVDFMKWYRQAEELLEWPFLLLDQQKVLADVFAECRELWQEASQC